MNTDYVPARDTFVEESRDGEWGTAQHHCCHPRHPGGYDRVPPYRSGE